MKIPKELKNRSKKHFKEYKKLDKMKPNRQIGRVIHEILHSDIIHDKITNHPKMVRLLEEHDRIIDSKPVWEEDKYIKFQEKYYKKAHKIIDSILTNEDYIEIFNTMLEYTPEELKQLELYQDSKDYWIDRI